MTKRIFNIYWTAIAAAVTIGACTGNTAVLDEVANPAVTDTAIVGISLSYDRFSTGTTRSSFEWEDSEIKDVQVIIVDKSTGIVKQQYAGSKAGIDTLSFMGVVGRTYDIWAAANLGGELNVSALDDFITGTRTVSCSDIARNGIPMYSESSNDEPGPASITVTGKNDAVQINMVRMLARIDLHVDKSGLDTPEGFIVNDVMIYNAINSYSPFVSGVKQVHSGSIDYSFDKASASDVTAINGGGVITLYAFENMQGELLAANNDPWKKVPGEISGSADYCSYLELAGSYSSGGEYYGKVTYRMYLGENSTTNFDVKRNTKYAVTLYPTEEEIDGHRGSWKIESSDYADSRSLAFSPRQLTVESLGGGSTNILKNPSDLSYDFSYNADDAADAGIVINRTGDSVSIESIREVAESKNVTLHIETTDGKHKDDCVITVTPKESAVDYELVLTPEEQTIFEDGELARIKAMYYTVTDGVKDSGRDVTDSATWTIVSGSQYIKYTYPGGYAWASGAGSATVRATYNGEAAKAVIHTYEHTPEVVYEMKITPENPTIHVGESIQFHITEWKYEDGVEVDYWVDFYGCSWDRSNTCCTINSNGLATGTSAGTVIITASYNEPGYGRVYDSTTLSIIAATPTLDYIELVMSPDEIKTGGTSTGTVIAYYSDGSTMDVTDDCTWSSNAPSGTFTGTTSGTFTVTACFGGKSGSDEVTVMDDVSYELVVTPASQTIDYNEVAYCTATFYTITNGHRNGGVDVTDAAAWSIVSGSSVKNDGDGEFSWNAEGTSTVKAAYSGASDIATISCNAKPAPQKVLQYITVSDAELVLGYDNGWGDFYTVTAYFSDNTHEDVTLDATYSKSGPILITPGSADATAEGTGSISVSYSYGGVTKTASVNVKCLTGIYWDGVNPGIENAHGMSNEWYFTLDADVIDHYTRLSYTVRLIPDKDYSYSGTGDMTIIKQSDYLDVFVNRTGQTLSFSATDPVSGATFNDDIDLIHY